MLFIEAINKTTSQQTDKKPLARKQSHTLASNQDSVDLSSAAHQVKEIHLDSETKTPLTANSSIFANLIEHVLTYIINTPLHLHSPEELGLENKKWQFFLQVPPMNAEKNRKTASYTTPEISHGLAKQLIFHIPVKPSYGLPVKMTLLLSPHNGSPETPKLFHTLPKENWLPTLKTPYSPELLNQQVTHHHIFLDQDGEPDQLLPIYSNINQSKLTISNDTIPSSIFGLRIWRAKNNTLSPIVLGDNKVGLLFVGHHKPLDSKLVSDEEKARQTSYLHTKA